MRTYSDPTFHDQAAAMGAVGCVTKEDCSQLFALIHVDLAKLPSP